MPFPTDRNPIKVCGGSEFLMFLTDKGDLFSYNWGASDVCSGLDNTLGGFKDSPRIIPYFMILKSLDHINIHSVSCGLEHTLALTDSGELYSWGVGSNGRLGIGDTNDFAIPQIVYQLIDKQIIKISCGNAHNIVMTDKGEIYVWGQNNRGQLGIKNKIDQIIPTILYNKERKFDLFVCGGEFSCFVDFDGVVYCCGDNRDVYYIYYLG